MAKTVVIDLGGTSIKSGLFTDSSLEQTKTIETKALQGAKDVIDRVIQLIAGYDCFDAIGISTCGSVNRSDGSIHYANENMPGYTGTKVKEIMETRFHVPCSVENDAICAAIGEKHFGAGKDLSDFALLTYGTGVGAGIYLNGEPYYGNGRNTSPFIGGIYLRDNSSMYETAASTTALVRNVQKADPAITNAKQIFEKEITEEVQQIIDSWCTEVALGLCTITHLFNMPAIIIGGGIMEQDSIFHAVENKFYENLIQGFQGTVLKKATLGNKAGIYGAYYNASHIIQ